MTSIDEGYWFIDRAEALIAETQLFLHADRTPNMAVVRDKLRTGLVMADYGFQHAKTSLRSWLIVVDRSKRGIGPEARRAYWVVAAMRTTSRLADPLEFDRLRAALMTAFPAGKLIVENAIDMLVRARLADKTLREIGRRVDGFNIEEGC